MSTGLVTRGITRKEASSSGFLPNSFVLSRSFQSRCSSSVRGHFSHRGLVCLASLRTGLETDPRTRMCPDFLQSREAEEGPRKCSLRLQSGAGWECLSQSCPRDRHPRQTRHWLRDASVAVDSTRPWTLGPSHSPWREVWGYIFVVAACIHSIPPARSLSLPNYNRHHKLPSESTQGSAGSL